ncbi:aldo/keto reductase [Robiginitalea sp. IMCC44478]|uniref:aldo/keto reductase n=1 Tax=Robiginitalea sp. IMCC44478 TaxID=3459122 RepID=UPI00404130DF
MNNRETPQVVLGTVQFGLNYGINNKEGRPTKERVFEILNTSHSLGIGLLDSAEAYGNSLELIGDYHRAFPNRKFQVISKFNELIYKQSISLEQRVKDTLAMLSTSNLHAYMYHRFEMLKEFPNSYDELRELKEKGLIKKIGISVYSNEQLQEVLDGYDFDLIQLPFNVFDNHKRKGPQMKRAHDRGIEIHVRSAFLQGLFFKNVNELPKVLAPLRTDLMELHRISKEFGYSIGELSLKYILSMPYVDYIVIGVDSAQQIEQNIRDLNTVIPNQVMERIHAFDVKATHLLNPTNWK